MKIKLYQKDTMQKIDSSKMTVLEYKEHQCKFTSFPMLQISIGTVFLNHVQLPIPTARQRISYVCNQPLSSVPVFPSELPVIPRIMATKLLLSLALGFACIVSTCDNQDILTK